MSPTAKLFKEKKEVEDLEEDRKLPAAVLSNSSSSPEECKPPAKRSRSEQEGEEPRKLPPLFFKKFKIPVIPRVYEEDEIPVELIKKRANKSIEETLKNVERIKDLNRENNLLNQEVSSTQLSALIAYSDSRDLIQKLTPEQLEVPHTKLLAQRLEDSTLETKRSLAKIKKALYQCDKTLLKIHQDLTLRHKVVQEAQDRLNNSGIINYPQQQAVVYDYFDRQIYLGDTVLTTLPWPYNFTEAVVIQLGENNCLYITPRRSGINYCVFGCQVELHPDCIED